MRDRTVTTERSAQIFLLEGLILPLHILLKYFFQGGKHTVTGLWAFSLALGEEVMLPAVQRSEDTGGRQGVGCKDTQLLLGDILHALPQKVSEGTEG